MKSLIPSFFFFLLSFNVFAETTLDLLKPLNPPKLLSQEDDKGTQLSEGQISGLPWRGVFGFTDNYLVQEMPAPGGLLIGETDQGGGVAWTATWEKLGVKDAKKIHLKLALQRKADTEGDLAFGIRLTTEKANRSLVFLEFWGEGDGLNLVGSDEKKSVKKSIPTGNTKPMQVVITVDVETQRARIVVDGDVVAEAFPLMSEPDQGVGLYITHPKEWGNEVLISEAKIKVE